MTLLLGNLLQANQITGTLDSAGQYIPTSECIVDELVRKRFLNFTCKGVVHLPIDVLCSGIDFNKIGLLLAECAWQTPFGNFKVGAEFITICHPISLPPQPESCLGLQFLLYTKLNADNPQKIFLNLTNIDASNFNFKENTTFLIGGWMGGSFSSAKQVIVPSILSCTNENVFIFDWGKGSSTLYSQAIANSRLAAADKYNYRPSKVHLVGHSIGAHLAGIVGAACASSIGRITGLDPAGPYYDCDPKVQLDPTDAIFVDIIHSNAGIAGTLKNLGHVDFWPNGGKKQPACTITKQLQTLSISCDHSISIYYYAFSMRFCDPSFNCAFKAFMCSSYKDFQSGECNSCGADGSKSAQMGYLAQHYQWAGYKLPAQNPFYLKAGSKEPYCLN